MVGGRNPGRGAVRAVLVILCALTASWGFAAGPHATSHAVAAASQPSHHSHGGQAQHKADDAVRARVRRRCRGVAVRLLPGVDLRAWAVQAWAVRAWRTRRPATTGRPGRARTVPPPAAGDPLRLGVCRT